MNQEIDSGDRDDAYCKERFVVFVIVLVTI